MLQPLRHRVTLRYNVKNAVYVTKTQFVTGEICSYRVAVEVEDVRGLRMRNDTFKGLISGFLELELGYNRLLQKPSVGKVQSVFARTRECVFLQIESEQHV